MAARTSKRKQRETKEKHKQKKLKKLESQDARGLSRKKFKLVLKPKTFFILKIVGIILIPLAYVLYSPLLALVMVYFVGLYFAAIGCEHSLNKSVIKSNHIKIPKYDSAIALLLVCVSLFGSIFGVSNTPVGRFSGTIVSKFSTSLKNFGSLLTGVRTVFGQKPAFGFGSMERPDGFIADGSEFREMYGDQRPAGMGGRAPEFEMSMDDVPIEFMFSQILSTALTIMVFAVMVLAIISLYQTYKKIKKFETEQNTIIIEKTLTLLSDEDLEKVVNFGEIEGQEDKEKD